MKTGQPSLPPGLAWALAFTATFTMSVSYVDRQTLAALAPTVTKQLHIDDTHYGFLLSGFAIAYLVGAPLAGRLVDVVGARRGLLGAVLVWSVVAGLHALAPSFAVLFTLRIALGLAESPSFPGAAQTVHRALPPSERTRGLGVLFTGSSFGAMVAPKLAAYFNEHWGWKAAFLGSSLVGLVWIPVWLVLAWNRRSAAVLDAREESGGQSAGAPSLLRNRAVWRGILMVVACAPLLAFHMSWLSKFLDLRFHVTQAQIGNFLVLPPLLFDIGAVLFGTLGTRQIKARPDSDAPPYGLITAATVIALLAVFLPMCPTPWSAMVLAGVSMAGGGGLYGLVTADVLRRVPPSAVSTAGGMLAAAQSLSHIVINPLIGRSVELTGTYEIAILGLAALHLPGAAAWLLMRPPPVHRTPAVAEIEVPGR